MFEPPLMQHYVGKHGHYRDTAAVVVTYWQHCVRFGQAGK